MRVKGKNITPGHMLRDARTYYEIDRSSLAHKICGETMYFRIENEDFVPDGLLFACLWERIGLSLNRVSILLSDEEEKWYLQKVDAINAINNKDIDKIRDLHNN